MDALFRILSDLNTLETDSLYVNIGDLEDIDKARSLPNLDNTDISEILSEYRNNEPIDITSVLQIQPPTNFPSNDETDVETLHSSLEKNCSDNTDYRKTSQQL